MRRWTPRASAEPSGSVGCPQPCSIPNGCRDGAIMPRCGGRSSFGLTLAWSRLVVHADGVRVIAHLLDEVLRRPVESTRYMGTALGASWRSSASEGALQQSGDPQMARSARYHESTRRPTWRWMTTTVEHERIPQQPSDHRGRGVRMHTLADSTGRSLAGRVWRRSSLRGTRRLPLFQASVRFTVRHR